MAVTQRLSASEAAAAAAAASARARLIHRDTVGEDGKGRSAQLADPTPLLDRPSKAKQDGTSAQDGAGSSTGNDRPGFSWLAGPVLGSFLGNALLLAVAALLAVVWRLFEEFREPLLWGLWCSITLRSAKDYLVDWLQDFLSARSLFAFITLPVELVCGIAGMLAKDAYEIASDWSDEMDAKTRDRAASLRVQAMAEKVQAQDIANGSDDEIFEDACEVPQSSSMERANTALQSVGDVLNWFWECTQLLSSASLKRKQHYTELIHKKSANRRSSDTALLFSALLSSCLLFEAYRFVESFLGWHALFVIWTMIMIGSIAFFISRVMCAYMGVDLQHLKAQQVIANAKNIWTATCATTMKAYGNLQGVAAAATVPIRRTERKIRDSLLANLDHYVAGMLCLLVLFGTFFGALFFVVQIGSEMQGAVTAAMSVEVNMGNMTHRGVMQYVPDWAIEKVDEGKAQLSVVIQENMPKAIKLMEDKANEVVAAYNLTEVVSELYIMYATAQCIPCTQEESHEFSVQAAKANAVKRQADIVWGAAEAEVSAAEKQLENAVQQWRLVVEAARSHSQPNASCPASPTHGATPIGENAAPICGEGIPDTGLEDSEAEQEVVKSDARLTSAVAAHIKAEEQVSEARAVAALASKRLQRCYHADRVLQEGGVAPLLSGEHLARFKNAVLLAAQLQFTEASREIKMAVHETLAHFERVVSARDITEGVDTEKIADPLTSFGQAFVDPIKDVAQSVVGGLLASLGHSVAMLVSGGASVVTSVMAVISASINFCSFVGLLYFLLSLDEDPIDTVIGVIPVAQSRHASINNAVRSALSGVFEVTFKLGFFHGLFTWLSLRILGAHFVYLPTLAAIIFSCFPLIPVTVVTLPAFLEFMISGAWIRAISLALAFLAAGGANDVIAAEVPGTNQFLTGMAIAGGMATFDNTFQGALIGPLLVAVVLMLKNLASEFSVEFSRSHSAER